MTDTDKGRLVPLEKVAPRLGYGSKRALYNAIRMGVVNIQMHKFGNTHTAPLGCYEADVAALEAERV